MRTSGVLMHISSLPSPYGIGTMGKAAYNFVDFLHSAGQTHWQTLPLCPTSFGDSPYSSFSTYAGNPYFIDLDTLAQQGLLSPTDFQSEFWGAEPTSVDYGNLYKTRYLVLRKATEPFYANLPSDFSEFIDKNSHWLEDYSLYMAIKGYHGDKSWVEWEDKYRFREQSAIDEAKQIFQKDIQFWNMLQYLFYDQWYALKDYANSKGIKIIGDIPIYTALDSADVWANTNLFYLDENLYPIEVAGVPPDGFSKDGQLWGNPLYKWDTMAKDGYKWWVNRLKHQGNINDITRIDNFRGFDSYYAVPYGEKTARNGVWKKGPGMAFFKVVQKEIPDTEFIAEDLGFLTPSVLQLVKDTGYPGMKILQFAFDSREDSDYLPHNYTRHSVVYTGTHDNDTILGWFDSANPQDTSFAINYLRLTKEEGYNWGMMNGAWASVANWVVVQMQDLLSLDNIARMNTPSTIGDNWKWRALESDITPQLAKKVYTQTELYRRLPGSC